MPDKGNYDEGRNEIRIDHCPSCSQETCEASCSDDNDDEVRQHEVTRWKFLIAFLVVSVILFLLCVVVVSDVVLQFRGSSLKIPQFLIDLCQITITAGLAFLGVGGLQAFRAIRKHRELNGSSTKRTETDDQ